MTAQPGILNPPALYHIHVEYRFDRFDDLAGLKHIIRAEQESAELRSRQVLFGFSEKLWSALSSSRVPKAYSSFAEIRGEHSVAPATQGDLWTWIHGDSHSLNLDTALNLHDTLKGIGAARTLEVTGFVRHENRDFTGFIDGTENPVGDDAEQAALVSSGNGSSFALTQKWIHKLKEFNRLQVSEQEQVIGRTKQDSIELEGDAMAPDSHVSRTDAEVDGVKQKILRRSVPHGNLDHRGLHFVAFACEIARFQIQLERMLGVSDDRVHDRLIEYSTPVSGSYWYVPTVEDLHNLI